jgi:hypothetical protein
VPSKVADPKRVEDPKRVAEMTKVKIQESMQECNRSWR